jgi:protein-tyrosine phosphatase
LLYRSVALHHVGDTDLAAFSKLGIRSVYDLRTDGERTAEPDRILNGVEHIVVDVLADATDAAPAQRQGPLSNPTAAGAMLDGDETLALFEDTYRAFVSLPSALAGYRRLYTDLSQCQHRPALVHCTTGKDRTGWAAAALLLLLGVPNEQVIEDFLLTNTELLPALRPVFDRFQAAGGDPTLLEPILGVRVEYLEASLDEMRNRFGTIDNYFTNGLGLDAATIAALRMAFVEDRA